MTVIAFDQSLNTTNEKDLRGGKGYYLHRMVQSGLPVPPGFTLTSDLTAKHKSRKELLHALAVEVDDAIQNLEEKTGKKFGSNLIVSVRSGAAKSMPGMMETILNIGLNDETVEILAKKTSAGFALDCYRRLIQMYGTTVMGIESDLFDNYYNTMKEFTGGSKPTPKLLNILISKYKDIIVENTGETFPQDPTEQLYGAILAVFKSWYSAKAKSYRKLEHIDESMGTAVNVQAMVFGNLDNDSGTGVVFSMNPNTGTNAFYGDFLLCAQGEDVVDGSHKTLSIIKMKELWPKIYSELATNIRNLEKDLQDMVDVEFTVESGKLYILQVRVGKRSNKAAKSILYNLRLEDIISDKEYVRRMGILEKETLEDTSSITVDSSSRRIGKGEPACQGIITGAAVFTSNDAKKAKEPVILIRPQTDPKDIEGMAVAAGIITATGGLVSHAAVIARSWNKPCVVGVQGLNVQSIYATLNDTKIKKGDLVCLNGETGEIFLSEQESD